VLFRLKPEDFPAERERESKRPTSAKEASNPALSDLSPDEWKIVKMVREAAGTHGRLITGSSMLARQCHAPPAKPISEAFDRRPTRKGD
jgi:hypothetical protein